MRSPDSSAVLLPGHVVVWCLVAPLHQSHSMGSPNFWSFLLFSMRLILCVIQCDFMFVKLHMKMYTETSFVRSDAPNPVQKRSCLCWRGDQSTGSESSEVLERSP